MNWRDSRVCVFVYSRLYRAVMRLAHRFHWHYAPPSYPDGDTMLWCHWCGFRQVTERRMQCACGHVGTFRTHPNNGCAFGPLFIEPPSQGGNEEKA